MIEVADIFRRHGPAYQEQHRLLPSQQKALRDLVRCRTAACGGQLYRCDHCGQEHYSYHSCGNRHCPKCHGEQTERWLTKQQQRLLPCAYYLLTFTLPGALRTLAWSQQKALYGLLLRKKGSVLNIDTRFIPSSMGDGFWKGCSTDTSSFPSAGIRRSSATSRSSPRAAAARSAPWPDRL